MAAPPTAGPIAPSTQAVSHVWEWDVLAWNLTQVVIYVIVGLAIFAVTYLIIDKVTPFSLHKELLEDKNQALAILLGAIFISIALVLAAGIR